MLQTENPQGKNRLHPNVQMGGRPEIRGAEDGTVIMTFTSNQYYPVLNWILEKGMYVTPLAPQKLVDAWRENVLAMYEEVKKLKR